MRFFADVQYGGDSFPAGSEIAFVGDDWNDKISSIQIPPGKMLVIYQDANFGGESLTLTENVVDLRTIIGPGPDGTWNDVVSSFKIY